MGALFGVIIMDRVLDGQGRIRHRGDRKSDRSHLPPAYSRLPSDLLAVSSLPSPLSPSPLCSSSRVENQRPVNFTTVERHFQPSMLHFRTLERENVELCPPLAVART